MAYHAMGNASTDDHVKRQTLHDYCNDLLMKPNLKTKQDRMVAEQVPQTANRNSLSTGEYNIEAGDKWFGEFIHTLRSHKLQLETKTASPEMVNLYGALVSGDMLTQFKISKGIMNMQLTQKAVVEYAKKLTSYGREPLTLAFHIADSKLRVWAVIEDDDEDTEDALFLAEAYVNAQMGETNFRITSTIVEKSDNLPVPAQYEVYI